MRLFFAGEIPDEEKAKLVEIQSRLSATGADVKWVEPENLHVTFRFIGDTSPRKLQDLKKIGETVARLYGSFNVSLQNLGAFPPKGPPRVIWAGIEEGKKNLSMVAQAIDSRLVKAGYKEDEHRFTPHITLGRVKSPRGWRELSEKLTQEAFSLEPWHLGRFVLKESVPTKTGSVYKDVFDFPLGLKIEPRRGKIRIPKPAYLS